MYHGMCHWSNLPSFLDLPLWKLKCDLILLKLNIQWNIVQLSAKLVEMVLHNLIVMKFVISLLCPKDLLRLHGLKGF